MYIIIDKDYNVFKTKDLTKALLKEVDNKNLAIVNIDNLTVTDITGKFNKIVEWKSVYHLID